MAETKKKAGRPKKQTAEKEVRVINAANDSRADDVDANSVLIKELMEQVKSLKAEVEAQKAEKQKSDNEKTDLQQLVDVLQSQAKEKKQEKVLPKNVKVISMLDNIYNLTNKAGQEFTFTKFGHTQIIRLSDLEEIISDAKYRSQAERGYFYICDSDVVEELGLEDAYKTINDLKSMELIRNLSSEDSVDMFIGLSDGMKKSVATKIAEDIASDKQFDLNKIDAIRRATGIDIQKMADDFKEIRERGKAKNNE